MSRKDSSSSNRDIGLLLTHSCSRSTSGRTRVSITSADVSPEGLSISVPFSRGRIRRVLHHFCVRSVTRVGCICRACFCDGIFEFRLYLVAALSVVAATWSERFVGERVLRPSSELLFPCSPRVLCRMQLGCKLLIRMQRGHFFRVLLMQDN